MTAIAHPHHDARGNPVGTASAEALARAETALWRMASFFDTPFEDLDAAAAADPAWLMPAVMRANFLVSLTEPVLLGKARLALRGADRLAAAAPAREQAHLAAAHALVEGDWARACALWDDILLQHPRDGCALQWAHLFDFHRGDALSLRQRVARVLPEWGLDDPLRPYVLGMHAFGLEESHLYDAAEAAGREACDAAKVPWATHAVAHVMEMQGRWQDGIAWLDARRGDWSEGNGFSGHHWWHLGLFRLEGLDTDAALALYDERLGGRNASFTLQRLDAAALLWRLRLMGVDTGTRWQALARDWDVSPAGVGHSVFNALHAVLALVGAERLDDAAVLVGAARDQWPALPAAQAAVATEVGLPLLQGLLAYAHGEPDTALQQIAPLRGQLHRIGGSHAQRDIVDQTLLAACAAGGGGDWGRALLNERLLARPATPLGEFWQRRVTAGRRR